MSGAKDKKTLRDFGLLVGGVFAALGLWLFFRHDFAVAGPVLMALGLVLFLTGALAPRLLHHIYVGWMTMAIFIGKIVSTILLSLIYYIIFSLYKLISALVGKQLLDTKMNKDAKTYWKLRETRIQAKEDYENQF